MATFSYRQLREEEFHRIGHIDRTERIRRGYRIENGRLVSRDVVWDCPPWSEHGPEHSISSMIEALQAVHDQGGAVWAALDGERLVGVAAFRPHLTETMGQLALLHVSHGYRRRGIGSRLCCAVETLARASGAAHLYVSATASESAVAFYRSRGFELAAHPDPDLYRIEPDDIHMIQPLADGPAAGASLASFPNLCGGATANRKCNGTLRHDDNHHE